MMARYLSWLVCIGVACGVGACAKVEKTKKAAIEIARNKMISSSNELNQHVKIDPDKIVVAKAEKESDGGWNITLVEGNCTYIVYADPGTEIDVSGISKGCFDTTKQWK